MPPMTFPLWGHGVAADLRAPCTGPPISHCPVVIHRLWVAILSTDRVHRPPHWARSEAHLAVRSTRMPSALAAEGTLHRRRQRPNPQHYSESRSSTKLDDGQVPPTFHIANDEGEVRPACVCCCRGSPSAALRNGSLLATSCVARTLAWHWQGDGRRRLPMVFVHRELGSGGDGCTSRHNRQAHAASLRAAAERGCTARTRSSWSVGTA